MFTGEEMIVNMNGVCGVFTMMCAHLSAGILLFW